MFHDVLYSNKAQKLLKKMDDGQTVLGSLVLTKTPEFYEILAYVGFDFVIIDQMHSSLSWEQLGNIVRALRGSDTAVLLRVEADPWYGSDDPTLTHRISRALSLGVDGIKVHISSLQEAKWCVKAGEDWHRYSYINDLRDFTPDGFLKEDDAAKSTLIIPSVECKPAIEAMPQIMDIPGLNVFGISMTDTSRMLGCPLDYEHPNMINFINKASGLAKERGIHLCANTGYAYQTWPEIAGRAKRMSDLGIKMIFLQTFEFTVQLAMAQMLEEVKRLHGQ